MLWFIVAYQPDCASVIRLVKVVLGSVMLGSIILGSASLYGGRLRGRGVLYCKCCRLFASTVIQSVSDARRCSACVNCKFLLLLFPLCRADQRGDGRTRLNEKLGY